MRALARILEQSPGDRRLLLEAIRETVVVSLRLRSRRVDQLTEKPTARRAAVNVDNVAWAVRSAARVIPGSTCLVRAVALQRMCARRGVASQVQVGVAKAPSGLDAHAWLECEGDIVLGGEEARRFTRLISL